MTTRHVAVAVVLVCVLGLARAIDMEELATLKPYNKAKVAQKGAAAGKRVGARAGAVAGKKAGRKAGQQAAVSVIQQINAAQATQIPAVIKKPKVSTHPKASRLSDNIDFVAKATTPKQWAKFQKSDPGAVQYFKKFDEDRNLHWSKKEWDHAIIVAIQRHYLPSTFDRVGNWAHLPKDANGEITLGTFLSWAAATKAHTAPGKVVKPPAVGFGTKKKLKDCEQAFKFYDKNSDGVIDKAEFSTAVQGRIADDHVESRWFSLPRKGPKGTMQFAAWSAFCVSLTGLPPGPNTKRHVADPCRPNPCKEVGTVCIRDIRPCLKGKTCKQYKCIPTGNAGTPIKKLNVVAQCVRRFKQWDTEKNGKLSEKEFMTGVAAAKKGNKFYSTVNPKVVWNHFDVVPVDLSNFVKFCIVASKQQTNVNSGTAKEECWDVFSHWDKDHSQDLSKAEFKSGMRVAKQKGHMPITLDIENIWNIFPKTNTKLQIGPFVDWCLLVSKGVDATRAAKATLAPVEVTKPKPTQPPHNATNGTTTNATTAASIKATITLHMSLPKNLSSFKLQIVRELAATMNIPSARLEVLSVTQGSVHVQIKIKPPAKGVAGVSPKEIFTKLKAAIATKTLAGSILKTATSVADTTHAPKPYQGTVYQGHVYQGPTSSTSTVKPTNATKGTVVKGATISPKSASTSIASRLMSAAQRAASAAVHLALLKKTPKKLAASAGPTIATQKAAKDAVAHAVAKTPVTPANDYCSKLFGQYDVDGDKSLSMDEFHSACESFATKASCKLYPIMYYAANTNRGDGLDHSEFNNVCANSGVVPKKAISAHEARKAAAAAGAVAGKIAGSIAGAAAGKLHGEKAGIRVVPVKFREVLATHDSASVDDEAKSLDTAELHSWEADMQAAMKTSPKLEDHDEEENKDVDTAEADDLDKEADDQEQAEDAEPLASNSPNTDAEQEDQDEPQEDADQAQDEDADEQ